MGRPSFELIREIESQRYCWLLTNYAIRYCGRGSVAFCPDAAAFVAADIPRNQQMKPIVMLHCNANRHSKRQVSAILSNFAKLIFCAEPPLALRTANLGLAATANTAALSEPHVAAGVGQYPTEVSVATVPFL